MAKTSLWIGIDAGADDLSLCGTDDNGNVVFQHSCATKAAMVHNLLKRDKRRIQLIAIESGSSGTTLTRSLRKLGYPVAVFEARQASKFLAIRRNKTDKNDARGLADLARLGRATVSEVRVKSLECERMRSTLMMRQKLVQLRVTMEGALRSLVRLNGGRLKSSSTLAAFQRNVEAEIARMRRVDQIDLRESTAPLVALSVATRGYVETLDKGLREEADDNSVCRRFMEIPGVGPLTALSLFSSIEDPHRFRRSADVGAFFGLVPTVRESGQLTTKRRISKAGDKLTRTLLTTAAQHHVQWANTAISAWAQGLSKRLGKRGVQVAVARKLAVTMVALWKADANYEPFPPVAKALSPEVDLAHVAPSGAAG
jgi:transposase